MQFISDVDNWPSIACARRAAHAVAAVFIPEFAGTVFDLIIIADHGHYSGGSAAEGEVLAKPSAAFA